MQATVDEEMSIDYIHPFGNLLRPFFLGGSVYHQHRLDHLPLPGLSERLIDILKGEEREQFFEGELALPPQRDQLRNHLRLECQYPISSAKLARPAPQERGGGRERERERGKKRKSNIPPSPPNHPDASRDTPPPYRDASQSETRASASSPRASRPSRPARAHHALPRAPPPTPPRRSRSPPLPPSL